MTDVTFGNYVLGLAGLALIRRWYEPDAEQKRGRLLELANGYSTDEVLRLPLEVQEHAPVEGYTIWADSYDGPNPMIAAEERVVLPRLAELFQPGMTALDVGCGTGRHSRALADLGFAVTGVDLTPAMLDVARAKVPEATFAEGSFERLPVPDNSMDLVTSALAVCHATDLGPVFAEFARVLRPGGRVVISDPHPVSGQLGGQAFFQDGAAMPYVRNHTHPLSDYVQAMAANDLMIEDLQELPYDPEVVQSNPASAFYPDETAAALLGFPFVVIWQARLQTS